MCDARSLCGEYEIFIKSIYAKPVFAFTMKAGADEMNKCRWRSFMYIHKRAMIIALCSIALILTMDLGAGNAAHNQTFEITQLEKPANPEKPNPEGGDKAVEGEKQPDEKKPIAKPIDKLEIRPQIKKAEEETYPPIMRDVSKLPFPVRRMRELILEAAMGGDIEKLRPLIGYGDDVTMLSLGGIEEDPLGFLKSLSGDKEGHEILAILVEILESGFVHIDEDSEQEMYVWPYFFAWPLDKLNPSQKVELYGLVTYGDYEDMESFGAYIFYRLGITPRGRWNFFVAGD